MPRLATAYRILIASPSDVKEERELIREVIMEWNATNSLRNNVILEPVSWESHSMPEMGDRPQELLNNQIVRICDALIGIFWTRIGTNTGKADSGTVEEINEFINDRKPVLLYFSKKSVNKENVDNDQYTKLKEFKEKCKEHGIVFDYSSNEELSHLLIKHISKQVDALQKVYGIVPLPKENEEKLRRENEIKDIKKMLDLIVNVLDVEWDKSITKDVQQYSVLHALLSETYERLWEIYRRLDFEGTDDVKMKLKEVLIEIKDILSATEKIYLAEDLWRNGQNKTIKIKILTHLTGCINAMANISK